jgi:hypothetical protein
MFQILMEQIALLVIYMAAGMVLVRTHIFDQATLAPLAKFVLKMALPLLIFTNTLNGVDRETLLSTLPVIGLAALMYFLLYWLLLALARVFRVDGDHAPLYRALGMFGNVGFMGIPIISNLFPERGMLYISLFTIVDMGLLWTLGVKLTAPPAGKKGFDPKKLVNPVTVAILLALVMILLGVPLPGLLNTALTRIGSTCTPVAMIYLGGVFACMDIRPYLKRREFYGIAVGKMILFPLAFCALLTLMPLNSEIRATMALLSAMPSMSSIVMMANASGADGDYATGGICVTTLASIVTVPLAFALMSPML